MPIKAAVAYIKSSNRLALKRKSWLLLPGLNLESEQLHILSSNTPSNKCIKKCKFIIIFVHSETKNPFRGCFIVLQLRHNNEKPTPFFFYNI